MDLDILKTELSNQIFIGKDDLLEAISGGEIVIKSESLLEKEQLKNKYRRFLNHIKLDTKHKEYLKEVVEELLLKLESIKGENFLVVNISFSPFYVFSVFIESGSNQIISAIRGYDIQKMPKTEWRSMWGDPPSL